MSRKLWVLVLLAIGGCATVWWGAPVKKSRDHILVPHARHAKAGVECIACHEAIYDAKDLATPNLPPEKKCLECHREAKEQGKCTMCHTDPKHAAPWPEPDPATIGIKVDHAAHLGRTGDKCEPCHKQLPEPLRTKSTIPTMDSCLSCHEHKKEFNAGKCDGCHTDLKRYPLKPISSFSHEGNFIPEHGRFARASADACATCHEQTFCTDCHAGTASPRIEIKMPERVERDFIHRNDFRGRHAQEAAADPVLCARCHGVSFCQDCHRQNSLLAGTVNPRNPHPPGWVLGRGGGEFHGSAARRDIASCAACHDQGASSNCVKCHKVGGIGGNPHPPGWNRSRDEIRTNNMCLVCHDTAM